MSFILSELRFPHLRNGYPNTDFCGLLELNENMCRARGSENHSYSTWTAKRRVWKVSREPGSSPTSASDRDASPCPRPCFSSVWNGEDGFWPAHLQRSIRDPGVNGLSQLWLHIAVSHGALNPPPPGQGPSSGQLRQGLGV